MKLRTLAGVLLATLFLSACDDTTNDIGISLVNNMDNLNISTDTFTVSTRSIVADSVLSRTTTGFLGRIKDPETGNFITGNFMTQFHVLESYTFPDKDKIVSKKDGKIICDSCYIRLSYNTFFGDSLAVMKVRAHEMDKPMLEDQKYYSNFDPISKGYVSTDRLKADVMYTTSDLSVTKSNINKKRITIPLNEEYIDRNGNKYNNIGSYLMNTYYEHPEYFKNSITFIRNVIPGFYFESIGGLGSIAYIERTQLAINFRFQEGDSVASTSAVFSGTEEVLQTSKLTNSKDVLEELAADNSCTYLKSPAGIFTEMTIPVDDILKGHINDSITTAKVVITRINDEKSNKYALPVPKMILMIPADSLYTFFENNHVTNNRTSYTSTLSTSNNTYTFTNIGNLISYMNANRHSSNWNKVVLIPVVETKNSSGSTTKIIHDMTLRSTRLVGGEDNKDNPIKISVIYSKFN